MAVTQEQIGELVAKIFDRLDSQHQGAEIMDAIVLVELSDPTDTVVLDDGFGREAPATEIMLEATTDRVTVQEGILRFALRGGFDEGDDT
jgi:hypothetical protein